MRRLISSALLAALLAGTASAQVTTSSVTFTFVNETGLDGGVSLSVIEKPNGVPRRLDPVDLGGGATGWTFKTPDPPEAWMAEPSFVIGLPDREPEGDLKVPVAAMEVTLSFRVRPIYGQRDFQIPVRLIRSTSKAYFDDIASMPPRTRLEQLILLAQFATNLVHKNPNDEVTQNAVRAWFDTLLGTFARTTPENQRLPLRFDGDIQTAVETAFSNKPDTLQSRYLAQIAGFETTFWLEPKDVLPSVLADGRCELAPLLVAYVREHHTANSGAARAQGIPDIEQQFAAMDRQIADKCDGPLPKHVTLPQ